MKWINRIPEPNNLTEWILFFAAVIVLLITTVIIVGYTFKIINL